MSQPSANYIEKVMRWTYGQIDLARINMPLPGQFRARLCLECYMLWQQNKSTNVRRIVQNIAARDYSTLMSNAELGNEEAKAMVEALGIRRDDRGVVSGRRETEIANDIYGNLYLTDGTDRVYVYGCYPGWGATGDARKGLIEKLGIKVGDKLSVIGVRAEYKGTPQLSNGIFFSHIPAN